MEEKLAFAIVGKLCGESGKPEWPAEMNFPLFYSEVPYAGMAKDGEIDSYLNEEIKNITGVEDIMSEHRFKAIESFISGEQAYMTPIHGEKGDAIMIVGFFEANPEAKKAHVYLSFMWLGDGALSMKMAAIRSVDVQIESIKAKANSVASIGKMLGIDASTAETVAGSEIEVGKRIVELENPIGSIISYILLPVEQAIYDPEKTYTKEDTDDIQ